MGACCTKLKTIDLNNNGKSDIEELIAIGIELAVERVLANLQQHQTQSVRSVDVHIVDNNTN